MHEWINLTGRYGMGKQNPTEHDLKEVLNELFNSKDDEHPDAWIECGTDDGPLYSLSIFSSGYALFTKYSDVDMTEELEAKKIENVNKDTALQLWKNLIDGNINEIKHGNTLCLSAAQYHCEGFFILYLTSFLLPLSSSTKANRCSPLITNVPRF